MNLPTVVTGWEKGMKPKLYWKNPRPIRIQGHNPISLRTRFWNLRSQEPGGNGTWSYKLVSPNENTGTSGVLKIKLFC